MKLIKAIQLILRYAFCIVIFSLSIWLAYVIGISDGRGQVVSVYDVVQPIRVTQRLLGLEADGIVGNQTLSAWKKHDRENYGFIEEYVYPKELK